jgi:hypothetical protein
MAAKTNGKARLPDSAPWFWRWAAAVFVPALVVLIVGAAVWPWKGLGTLRMVMTLSGLGFGGLWSGIAHGMRPFLRWPRLSVVVVTVCVAAAIYLADGFVWLVLYREKAGQGPQTMSDVLEQPDVWIQMIVGAGASVIGGSVGTMSEYREAAKLLASPIDRVIDVGKTIAGRR